MKIKKIMLFRALCDVYGTFHINCGISVEGKEFLWQHKL